MRHLTPELAEMYATKTDKTLTRDLNALRDMDLLRRVRGGYLPRNEVILGFMPEQNAGVLAVEAELPTQPPQLRPLRSRLREIAEQRRAS
jgi:hypothetical protein